MSLKQTKIFFGSNRNEPKQDLLRFCFSLFWETKNKKFRFVSVCLVVSTYIETTETNRTVSKQPETTQNFLKNTEICSLSNCFGWSSVCFSSIEHQNSLFRYKTETNCLETTLNFVLKNTKICSLSHSFSCSFVFFGSIQKPKLSVSV